MRAACMVTASMSRDVARNTALSHLQAIQGLEKRAELDDTVGAPNYRNFDASYSTRSRVCLLSVNNGTCFLLSRKKPELAHRPPHKIPRRGHISLPHAFVNSYCWTCVHPFVRSRGPPSIHRYGYIIVRGEHVNTYAIPVCDFGLLCSAATQDIVLGTVGNGQDILIPPIPRARRRHNPFKLW